MGLANALLRITGDSTDAKAALSDAARELAELGRQTAEATFGVDTAPAKRSLAEVRADIAKTGNVTAEARVELRTGLVEQQLEALRARLVNLSQQEASPKVDVQTAKTVVAIDALEAKLAKLGASKTTHTVDVNVDRDKITAAGGIFSGLAKNIGLVPSAAGEASASLGSQLPRAIGSLLPAADPAALAVTGLVAVIGVAFASAVAVLVASAAAAVLAIGAIATAAALVALPAIAGLIELFRRFKAEADKAGTPANALKKAFGELGDTFDKVLGPAADTVFGALAKALPEIGRLLLPLKPAFGALGDAVGEVIGKLTDELGKPAWAGAIRLALETLVRLVKGPAFDAFIAFAGIFRDIAVAAMPALESAAQGVADALGSIADRTSDTSALSGVIETLVGHLESWFDLTKQVARIVLAFFTAAAPAGQSLVDALADGAKHLADFLNSAQGQQAMRDFFAKVVPLAVELAKSIGLMLLVFAAVVEAVAPFATVVLKAFNAIAKAAFDLVGGVDELGGVFLPLAAIIGAPAVLIATQWRHARDLLLDIFGAISTAATTAFDAVLGAVKTAIGAVITFITGAADRAKAAAGALFNGVVGGISGKLGDVSAAVQNVVGHAVDVLRGYVDEFTNGARGLFNGVVNGVAGKLAEVSAAVQGVIGHAVDVLRGYADEFTNGARALFNGVVFGIGGKLAEVSTAIQGVIGHGLEVLKGYADNFTNGAAGLFNGVVSGIGSKAKDVAAAAASIANSVLGTITDINDAMLNAGKNVMILFGNGIIAGAKHAIDVAKAIAKKIKDLLPGSEPKDPTSPLRGLGASGTALMENLAAGVPAGARTLVAEVRAGALAAANAATGTAADIGLSAAPAAILGGVAAAGGGGSYAPTYNFPPAPGGGNPDPAFLAAQLEALLRDRGVLAGMAA